MAAVRDQAMMLSVAIMENTNSCSWICHVIPAPQQRPCQLQLKLFHHLLHLLCLCRTSCQAGKVRPVLKPCTLKPQTQKAYDRFSTQDHRRGISDFRVYNHDDEHDDDGGGSRLIKSRDSHNPDRPHRQQNQFRTTVGTT